MVLILYKSKKRLSPFTIEKFSVSKQHRRARVRMRLHDTSNWTWADRAMLRVLEAKPEMFYEVPP